MLLAFDQFLTTIRGLQIRNIVIDTRFITNKQKENLLVAAMCSGMSPDQISTFDQWGPDITAECLKDQAYFAAANENLGAGAMPEILKTYRIGQPKVITIWTHFMTIPTIPKQSHQYQLLLPMAQHYAVRDYPGWHLQTATYTDEDLGDVQRASVYDSVNVYRADEFRDLMTSADRGLQNGTVKGKYNRIRSLQGSEGRHLTPPFLMGTRRPMLFD